MSSPSSPVVAVVGGTGHLGAAIARRLARSGWSVVLGSRDEGRARTAAATLSSDTSGNVRGATNAEAAAAAEIVIVAVPFASQREILADIRASVTGKIVVDTTVPLVPPKVMRVQLPTEGSAAVIAQNTLGEGVTVVSAFHNVPAHKLATDDVVQCDVLVFGDDKQAREQVVRIAQACGLRGLHGGPLVNSAAAEALTSTLIFINKHYAVAEGAGMQITGELRGAR